jgi:hypothetical protein
MATKNQQIPSQQLILPNFHKIPIHIKPVKSKDSLLSNSLPSSNFHHFEGDMR